MQRALALVTLSLPPVEKRYKKEGLKTIIIDDEPGARAELRGLLQQHSAVEVLDEAGDITEALRKIDQLKPDLIFLDIEMPGGSGFDLVRQLPRKNSPEVIFVSGEKGYGLQAFRSAALDYITKPVLDNELADAVARASTRVQQKASAEKLETVLQRLEDQDYAENTIIIPGEGGDDVVCVGDVVYCQGVDGYTQIHLKDGSSRLSSYSLGQYRKLLPEPYFMVTHRSYLVHRRFVTKTLRKGELLLSTGAVVLVSRMNKDKVANWLKWRK